MKILERRSCQTQQPDLTIAVSDCLQNEHSADQYTTVYSGSKKIMAEWNIETKCVQSGYRPKNGEPREVPIYQSTTFKYDTSADMAKLFDLEASGYFYTRLQNPTNDYVAAKIAAMVLRPK